jgi:hypothetical protein
MNRRILFGVVATGLFVWTSAFAFQRGFGRGNNPFRGYDSGDLPMPADANDKTEWAFARLQYPQWGSRGGGGYGRWRQSWTTDYPKADRQFVQGVRRLTRLSTKSIEQVVSADTDELFNWPWIYAVEVGHWDLTDAQCKRLREFFDRGGFLMVDDFHGTQEWEIFMASMTRIFPELTQAGGTRQIVDLENKEAIFHIIYDLDERFQVPGTVNYPFNKTYEYDGYEAKWRGIYDDKHRLMVAICHNMDLGDAWEWADSPHYPEKYTSLAYRIGINYIVYSMTH